MGTARGAAASAAQDKCLWPALAVLATLSPAGFGALQLVRWSATARL